MDFDKNELYPKRRCFCASLRKAFYFKCLALSSMIFGCAIVATWCHVFTLPKQGNSTSRYAVRSRPTLQTADVNQPDSSTVLFLQSKAFYGQANGPCDNGYAFIPMAFATMLYLLYLIECWHYRYQLDQISKNSVENVYDYVERLKSAYPVVWWQAVSYHYTRRTRHITRYRNGDAVVANQVYYERVNSKTATSGFLYQRCGVRDISKRLVGVDRHPVTKIHFTKCFVFTNVQVANEFEDQRANFFQNNELVDDYMEIREGMNLLNVPFQEYVFAFRTKNEQPWYYSKVVYWLLSVCLLSWPLRVFTDCRTAHAQFQVTKLFGTNYLSPSSRYSTAFGGVGDTVPSEGGDQNDSAYLIVPSYSEAMLMDLAPGTVVADTWHTGCQQNGHWPSLTDRFKQTIHDLSFALRPARRSRSLLVFARRSRSLTFAKKKAAGEEEEESAHTSDTVEQAAPRSISFGGVTLTNGHRQQYSNGPITELDHEEDDQPPPSYDAAVQCATFLENAQLSKQNG